VSYFNYYGERARHQSINDASLYIGIIKSLESIFNTIEYIKRWTEGNYGGMSINRSMISDTLLFADDEVFIATSEDELQRGSIQPTKDDFRF
jgi:hypothetical protein